MVGMLVVKKGKRKSYIVGDDIGSEDDDSKLSGGDDSANIEGTEDDGDVICICQWLG